MSTATSPIVIDDVATMLTLIGVIGFDSASLLINVLYGISRAITDRRESRFTLVKSSVISRRRLTTLVSSGLPFDSPS